MKADDVAGERAIAYWKCAMSNDNALRQEIRQSLSGVRALIRNYSGLYSSENLAHDVLRACEVAAKTSHADLRLAEARRMVEDRCNRLALAADRFSGRDPALIAASRAQAVASIDFLQDAIFELRKVHVPGHTIRGVLRRKSL